MLIGNAAGVLRGLDPAVTKEMLGDELKIVSTGVFSPQGRAVPDGEGHLCSTGAGHSGCVHADWFRPFLVMDGDWPALRPDGRPDWRFAYFRRRGPR